MSLAESISPEQTVTGQAATAGRGVAVLLLAVAAFVIVTTEYVIVGLLPGLAEDLGISISAAGQLVTLFAFTVMLFGPVLTVLLSHFERKRLFIAILLIFAASNALTALAPNIWVLGLGRFLPALALPVFWGTASETAGELVGPERAGRAVANVYFGISAALVFGIPMGTLASDAFGWRGTFWGLSALSLLMALLLVIFMPTLARPPRLRIAEQLRILRDKYFLGNVVLSVVVFTAMFTSYTYLADTLQSIAKIPASQVGWWLMGFGAVGMAGNWLGGQFVGRNPLGATLVAVVVLAIGMALVHPLAGSHGWLALALATWGIANTALFPICQVRVMQSASHAQALAGTLNVAMANAGIGFGAIIGGATIQHVGLWSVGYVAATIAVIAIVLVPVVVWLKGGRAA
jgi:DHA1 family inner membrane transport protein